MQNRRDQFFAVYPKARVLDQALRTSDNPTPLFFLAPSVEHADLKNVGFALGRLGPDIERQFLVNGEIAFFFAPWRDFQRRSYNVMTKGLQEYSKSAQRASGRTERFTPSTKVVVLVSEDPQAQSKVEEWQQDSTSPTLVVAVPVAANEPEEARVAVLSQLRASLGERDLYRTQNPVTGDDFFGRQEMLRNLSAALQSDENVAILGLRRSGKTSVLRELKRQMLPRRVILTLGDFQVLEEDSVESLCKSLILNLVDDLREARSAGLDVRVGDQREQEVGDLTAVEMSDRLKRTANRNPDLRFVIAIDEVESAARIAKTEPEKIRILLAALRATAQACPNVSLAFSGVANRIFRTTVLGQGPRSVDNPMFGQVTSTYITAFSPKDTDDLLQRLGRPMFMDWSPEAVDDVQRATGGMPYFVRNLASAVRRQVKDGEESQEFSMTTVGSSAVAKVLPKWREDAGHDWRQLIDALRLHYSEAADLLDPSLTEAELQQWAATDSTARDAADDLMSLGLLARTGGGSWVRTDALRAVHSLAADRLTRNQDVGDDDAEGELLGAIRAGESHLLELKETFRINSHTGAKDAKMEEEVARAVAGLLNSDGGRVIVGVHDSGEVKGLGRDLKLFRGNFDQFERWIKGDLLGRRIDSAVVSQCVRLSWVDLRGARVCVLEVSPSSEVAWLDDQHLHVRNDNQTIELIGRQLGAFIASRS